MNKKSPAASPPMTMRRRILTLVALLGVVGAIMGMIYGYQYFFGAKIGEPCQEHLGCMAGGVCISRVCQKRCNGDGDCPSGMECGISRVKVIRQRPILGDDVSSSTEKICFPNSKMLLDSQPR